MFKPRNNRRFTLESLERRELMTADPGWGFNLGAIGSLNAELALTVGADDSLYVTGAFTGTIDFDPGPGVNQVTTPTNVQYGYVAKYTQQGGLAWASTFSGYGSWGTFSRAIELDAAGNVYVAGSSNAATLQFGATTLANQGSYDAFVAKLDGSNGAFNWAKGLGGTGEEQAIGLAVSDAGEAYVTGMFSNTVDFDPSTAVAAMSAPGEAGVQDGFVWKLDSQGNYAWARQFGAEQYDSGHRVTLGAGGEVYAVGHFRGAVDFSTNGSPVILTGPASGAANAYLVKLDPISGDTQWARQMNGENNAAARVAADGAGNVYVAGSFSQSVTIGDGPTFSSGGATDGYVCKWDSSGNVLWAEQIGQGTGDFYFHSLTLNGQDQPVLSARFSGTADVDPGFTAINLNSVDGNDGAVIRLTQSGELLSSRQFAGAGETRAISAVEDAHGNVFVAGIFQGNVTLPTGEVLTRTGYGTFINKIAVAAPTKFFVADGAAQTHEYDSNGNRTDNYALGAGNTAPRGAASNVAGDKVWVIDANKKVYVYNNAGGLLGSWTANGLTSPQGITTNGTDVWILDSSTDKVYKYTGAASRLSGSQSAASNFNLNSQNSNATDLVTDGASIWAVNSAATDKVFKYNLAGALQGSWTIDSRNTSPTGITLDPASPSTLWIVDNATDQVFAYAGATTRTSGSQAATIAVNLGLGNSDPQGIADPPAAADAALFEVLDEAFGQRFNVKERSHDRAEHTSVEDHAADYVFNSWYAPAETVKPKRIRASQVVL